MNVSPLNQIKAEHTSKEKLVDSLVGVLKKHDDESKEEFKKRLLAVSNRKLMRLQKRVGADAQRKPKARKKSAAR